MKKIKQELDNFSDTLKNLSFLLIFLANFCIIFIKLSRRFCRRFFLAPPNVGGAFLLPKGIIMKKSHIVISDITCMKEKFALPGLTPMKNA